MMNKTAQTRMAIFCCLMLGLGSDLARAQATANDPPARGQDTEVSLEQPPRSLWVDGIGNGFEAGTSSFSASAAAAAGMTIFGSREAHDLALLSLSYGKVLGGVTGDGWHRGNWEGRLELFAGAEFAPSVESLIGLTPHLRYDFATGTPWVPFADVGAGVTATSIGPPDLSGTFEFNLQAGFGTYYFFRKNLAATFEARYIHLSCARIHKPNLGLNSIMGTVGLTWFF